MGRGRPRTKHLTAKERTLSKVTVDRKPIRPLERQRMRPWLMQLLDSNSCRQLVWINKQQNMFRMSWKHAAGQTFDPNSDATLFELWARHTGKYYSGDKPDPKKWKANFRCALNSLQDVEEEKSQGIRKGNNAFKVYKFLDQKRPKRNSQKRHKESDDEEYDAELEVLKKNGTRSRPRLSTPLSMDSEGSENAYSSASDSGHSDWDEMTANDSRCQDQIMETDGCEKLSPLPDFEQLCQSTNVFPLKGRSKKQDTLTETATECHALSFSPIRSIDIAYSPEYNTHLVEASPNSSPHHMPDEAGETVDGTVQENGDIMLDIMDFGLWGDLSQDPGICYVQEAPEHVIVTDLITTDPNPNVIVITEDTTHDYKYTSMADL